ncbi:diacylglycerol kinase (ATP) [Pedobacter sp. UYP30]|uniref:diacylglycerol kinase n=1 Tax=Pedobacter sp. UYP30 TaxID=1756400 RepID=UPI003391F3DB
MKEEKFSFKARIRSFKYAWNGLKLLFVFEHNARIHAVAALLVLVLSRVLKISSVEWLAVLGAIAMVFVAELVNSSIEKLADVVSQEQNKNIARIKDMAAAAVLVAAIFAVIVFGVIFFPKMF